MLSHALEELAVLAGPGATVVAMSQHGAHFVPMLDRFECQARSGATGVVGFTRTGPVAQGAHMLKFAASHQRAGGLARWGGDEFILLCPGADNDQVVRMAERIRGSIAEVDIDRISISLGRAPGLQPPAPGPHRR